MRQLVNEDDLEGYRQNDAADLNAIKHHGR